MPPKASRLRECPPPLPSIHRRFDVMEHTGEHLAAASERAGSFHCNANKEGEKGGGGRKREKTPLQQAACKWLVIRARRTRLLPWLRAGPEEEGESPSRPQRRRGTKRR